MQDTEKKLGRGLSALLGESKQKQTAEIDRTHGFVRLVPLNKITAGVYQPRQSFNQDELAELAESIKLNGVLQPIILRKSGEEDEYEIIAGERRFRAAKLADLKEIPAVVKKINNHEALEIALIENIQRADLSLTEEAKGYQRLVSEFSYTQEQIAKKTGKSRSHITNILRLLSLPEEVRELLDRKSISLGHARAIIGSSHPEKLAKKIVEKSLTVREIEDLARDEKIETIKNTPLLVMTESKIKFINSHQIVLLEEQLSQALGLETKISYNAFRQSGKIMLRFKEIGEIKTILKRCQTL
ncbi:MAG: ParB/RepB/Spo0J family partition protein [Alphaproteobacteria bacterium]|nr:ParB/RepB/Spo0J family partition protein [Alphaproteobacteria bacterium]